MDCKPDVSAGEVLSEDACNAIFLNEVEPCMAKNKGLVSACVKVGHACASG